MKYTVYYSGNGARDIDQNPYVCTFMELMGSLENETVCVKKVVRNVTILEIPSRQLSATIYAPVGEK